MNNAHFALRDDGKLHLYSVDAPNTATIRVPATSPAEAVNKVARELAEGITLDAECGELTIHLIGADDTRPPVVNGLDGEVLNDEPLAFDTTAVEAAAVRPDSRLLASLRELAREQASAPGTEIDQAERADRMAQLVEVITNPVAGSPIAARYAPYCAMTRCDSGAGVAIAHRPTGRGERTVEFLCDPHSVNAETRFVDATVLALNGPLGTDLATLPAQEVLPGALVWDLPELPEWEKVRFRWVVQQVAVVRSQRDELLVRWTYGDNRVAHFGYGELVTGVFRHEPNAFRTAKIFTDYHG